MFGKRLKKGVGINPKIYGIIALILLACGVVGFIWAQTNLIIVNKVEYESLNLPRQYSGYKIAHLANINNERVHAASKIKSEKPDLIVVSGGLTDTDGNYSNTVKELNELNNVATTLYIAQENDLEYIADIIDESDATYMNENSFILPKRDISAGDYIKDNCDKGMIKHIEKKDTDSEEYIAYIEEELEKSKNDTIQVLGINGFDDNIYDTKDTIFNITDYASKYRILLFGNYKEVTNLADTGINIVISGGTYGLKKNNDIAKGSVTLNEYQLFMSSGICSKLPSEYNTKRFMNFPEIQMITLRDGKVYKRNPLEMFIDIFVKDTGTIFSNDGGFQDYRYEYGGLDRQHEYK